MKRGPGYLGPMPDPFTGLVMVVVVVLLTAMFVLQACQAALPPSCP